MAVILIVGLILLGGIIYLQIFLSKKESKRLGLILPIISFVLALIFAVVSSFSYSATTSFSEVKDGEIVIVEEIMTEEDKGSSLFAAFILFIYYNILTIILLMIYFICRNSINKKKALEMMAVQDLE